MTAYGFSNAKEMSIFHQWTFLNSFEAGNCVERY